MRICNNKIVDASIGSIALVWVSKQGYSKGDDLCKVDKSDGMYSIVGESCISTGTHSLACDDGGVLHLLNYYGEHYTVDTSDGSLASVGSISSYAFYHQEDIKPGTLELYTLLRFSPKIHKIDLSNHIYVRSLDVVDSDTQIPLTFHVIEFRPCPWSIYYHGHQVVKLCLESNTDTCINAPRSYSFAYRGSPDDVGINFCTTIHGVELANPDYYDDLDVAFDSQELQSLFDCSTEDVVTLVPKGETYEETPLESSGMTLASTSL